MNQYEGILSRLKEARDTAGLTQSQVGKMIHLSTAGFSDIEKGRNPMSVERLLKLVEIYGVSIEWVMTGINPNYDPQPLIEMVGEANVDLQKLIGLLSMVKSNG